MIVGRKMLHTLGNTPIGVIRADTQARSGSPRRGATREACAAGAQQECGECARRDEVGQARCQRPSSEGSELCVLQARRKPLEGSKPVSGRMCLKGHFG